MDKGVLLRFDVAPRCRRGRRSRQLLGRELALQAHLPVRLAAVQGRRDARDRSVYAEPRVSLDGRPQRLRRVPGMKPVMQMRIGWSLATANGAKFTRPRVFYALRVCRRLTHRRKALAIESTVDLTPRAASTRASAPASAEEGRRLYQLPDAARATRPPRRPYLWRGPTWKGLYGQSRSFANRAAPVIADEAYLRESILRAGGQDRVGLRAR